MYGDLMYIMLKQLSTIDPIAGVNNSIYLGFANLLTGIAGDALSISPKYSNVYGYHFACGLFEPSPVNWAAAGSLDRELALLIRPSPTPPARFGYGANQISSMAWTTRDDQQVNRDSETDQQIRGVWTESYDFSGVASQPLSGQITIDDVLARVDFLDRA
jgi:hypothetical protein